MSLLKQIEQLKNVALREHYYCEDDGWYSCPKSEGDCFDDRFKKDECLCGADDNNAMVEKLFLEIKTDLTKFSELGYIKL